MNKSRSLRRTFALLVGIAAFASSGWAAADPPSRVARLAFTSGAVSLSPAGDDEWVQASVNRPLTTGDRLWADANSRAEVQVGGAVIRMDGSTSVSVLNLDDRIAQLQLAQGIMNVRVRYLGANQVFEVDTPNLAFTLRRPGEFRIEVDANGDATSIVVRSGQGEAYGDGAAYVVDSRQAYRFYGTGLRDYEYVGVPRADDFDGWARDRDRRGENSVAARYVSRDVVGYEDLDAYGTWRVEPEYGNVWVPTRVASGWSPYHDGHWAWVDPWGWTWVDDAPWGFAVSHYGRWANTRGNWVWVPGPVRSQAVYAPALVAFVGGSNFQLSISGGNVGGIAWFPLGPRDVYRPAYQVSRGYFDNINRSNTVINNTTITNVYNNTNVTNIVYANQQIQGAVIAVPATAFVQSQSVSRAAVPLRRDLIIGAPVSTVAAVAPVQQSVHGNGRAGGKPPAAALERSVVARTAPPPAPVGFAAQERQLAAKPGQPLDEGTRKDLKPAKPMVAAKVEVVTPAKAATPTAPPPPVAQTRDGRGNDRRGNAAAPSQGGTPAATPSGNAPAAVTAPAGAQPKPAIAEKRNEPAAAPVQVAPAAPADRKGGAQGRKDDAKPAAVPPVTGAAPSPSAPPPAAAPAPSVAAPAPPAAAPPPRDQRGQRDARPPQDAPAVAKPPVTQPPVAQPPMTQPQVAKPPTPAANEPRLRPEPQAQPDRRGKPDQPAVAPPPAPMPKAPAPPPAIKPDAPRPAAAAAPQDKAPEAAPDKRKGGPKSDGEKAKSDDERKAEEAAKKGRQ